MAAYAFSFAAAASYVCGAPELPLAALVCETTAPVGELVSAAIAVTGAIPATSAAERAMPKVARLALLAKMSFISVPHFKGRRLNLVALM